MRRQLSAVSKSPAESLFYIESLESRRMLAGDVKLAVNGPGDVILTGDNNSNEIEVSYNPFLDRGVVRGVQGTTVTYQGVTANTHVFAISHLPPGEFPGSGGPAIARDLRINMRGGDDIVRILPVATATETVGLSVLRNLHVNLGHGRDRFEFEGGSGWQVTQDGFDYFHPGTAVHGTTTVLGGGDSDRMSIERVAAAGRVRMHSGPNGDSFESLTVRSGYNGSDIQLVGTAGPTSARVDLTFVRGDVSFQTGTGEDQHRLMRSYVQGNVRLLAGSTNNGLEYVAVSSVQVDGDLRITAGAGRSDVQFFSQSNDVATVIRGNTRISVGGGDDELSIRNDEFTTFEGSFSYIAGAGDDEIHVEGKTRFIGSFNMALGGGDDLAQFYFDPINDVIAGIPYYASVFGTATIHGNGGTDSIVDSDEALFFAGLESVSVENT